MTTSIELCVRIYGVSLGGLGDLRCGLGDRECWLGDLRCEFGDQRCEFGHSRCTSEYTVGFTAGLREGGRSAPAEDVAARQCDRLEEHVIAQHAVEVVPDLGLKWWQCSGRSEHTIILGYPPH